MSDVCVGWGWWLMPSKHLMIHLGNMADAINDYFGLVGSERVPDRLPLTWWWRTRHGGITKPLPAPYIWVGARPVWEKRQIVNWYARYKGLPGARGDTLRG